MKQVIQNFKDGELRLEEVPRPDLKPDGILVKNHYSCVSAGTEEAVIRLAKMNLLNKARERPDLAKKVIEKAKHDGVISTYRAVKGRLESPSPLGYSSCGEVVEVGENVHGFSVGDIVACAGAGYANHAEVIYVPKNLAAKVPDGVDTRDAAFTTIGAIAMQGVRRVNLSPGENVAVIGLGLIGLVTTQILKAYGSPVLGIDIDPGQVQKGIELGLDRGVTTNDAEDAANEFSNGHGVDAVIITASTSSDQPVRMAGDIARKQGRISTVGQVGMDIPRSVYYEKELDFRISRSYGPGRYDKTYEEKGLSYPLEHVRWTENRNMKEFLRLLDTGRVSIDGLLTHIYDLENALKAYELILENPNDESFIGIILKYSEESRSDTTVQLNNHRKSTVESNDVKVGLIGSGNFVKTTLLPTFSKIDPIDVFAVASSTGMTAKGVAEDVNAAYVTSDYREILEDDEIDLVVIATRNDTHSQMAVNTLDAGKDVHVEKPLALNEEELRDVVKSEQASNGRLMVGYNRRFSSAARRAKSKSSQSETPNIVNYRVNAETIPADHWINDPDVGGGRIVSEVCHFVDFLQFVTDSSPKSVYAQTLPKSERFVPIDNASIIVKLHDGSLGTINYNSEGDDSVGKEFIEVFGGGKTLQIDNFREGRLGLTQDKGHRSQFEIFVKRILNGEPSPIPITDLAYTTLTTFAINESIRERGPVSIELSKIVGESND